MLEINGTTLLNLDEVCQLVKRHRARLVARAGVRCRDERK
jgi:hypothetical protein